MSIDWFSFFIGTGAGVFLMSITGLISSYIRLKKARARVDLMEAKIKKFQDILEKKKEELIGRIEEEKKS